VTWFSNDTVIWTNKTDGWLVMIVLPVDNTFLSIQTNLSDPLFEVSPGDYNLIYKNIV
jgi:hypothetical protein